MMKIQGKLLAAALLVALAILLIGTTVMADSGTPDNPAQGTITTPTRGETYGVGWGTLMLINAGLAQGKNRSGLNWFLISLFLGPIATFLLVAFYPKQPSAKP